MNQQKFWMVLGSGVPTFRHPTKQAAANEAERLARENKGSRFYVLEAVAVVVTTDVAWEALEEEDDWGGGQVPF